VRRELEGQVADLTAVLEEADAARAAMHEVLVNHKRDVLVEQKVRSAVVQREMETLAEDRRTFDAQKAAVRAEIEEYEAVVKDLEHQLHVLSKTSAFTEGRVNPAHRKKKQRVNQDYEDALETVEAKQAQVRGVDAKIEALVEARHAKEDEMKALERALVEVLVEQQRRLLALITGAKSASKSLELRRQARAEKKAQDDERTQRLREAGLIP